MPSKQNVICACLILITFSRSSLQEPFAVTDGDVTSPEVVLKPCYSRITTKEQIDDSLSHLSLPESNKLICPPGYHELSETNSKYCYRVSEKSTWDYPCLKSGGATVISDLDKEAINYLLHSLTLQNVSRYYWLPAQRQKMLNPVVWYIPGPNWGKVLRDFSRLTIQTNLFKNCLLLDVEKGRLITETCKNEYPSLCFYENLLDDHNFKCPVDYFAFRFLPEHDTCFGIEHLDIGTSFDSFLERSCKRPMGDNKYKTDLKRFIFHKVSELDGLSDNTWCWFQNSNCNADCCLINQNETEADALKGVINKMGNIGLQNKFANLTCMACEKEMIQYQETDIQLEYNTEIMKLSLTVYFPSGLWRYNSGDTGFQCFSDANGFISVVDINDIIPFIEVEETQYLRNESDYVEKIVYLIDLVTERSAQYWCEAHTKNFSLISTPKIIANPRGNNLHVFALLVNVTIEPDLEDFNDIFPNITSVFQVEIAILMDILITTPKHAILVYHLHVAINEFNKSESEILPSMLENLKKIAEGELSEYKDMTFFKISSSIYCLPATSKDLYGVDLNWELTLIGHIAAPSQFCLQSNGLPVRRFCEGSYLLGGYWGNVDGYCDQTYKASETTSLLYNFFKGYVPQDVTAQFLTVSLNSILGNLDIIIPADIYYLSKSLEHVIDVAKENDSSIELSDVHNIAWVMDRIMAVDKEYLRLSQTLNSTNVILESIINIIEMISKKNENFYTNSTLQSYELSITPQFIVQISYPAVNNISGVAVLMEHNRNSFENVIIHPLFKNTTLNDVLTLQNLEVATWVPDRVLKSLKQNTNCSDNDDEEMHIIINIFSRDSVFQQLDDANFTINSRIIGVTIPGYISNLKYPIPILFKEKKKVLTKLCGYWNFQVLDVNKNPGFWTNHGCFYKLSYSNITVCECYHMTHFGELLDISGIIYPRPRNKVHMKALNIITLIGSMLSLLGVAGIWVTALVFQVWRKKASTKVLLQLSTSVALPLIFMLIFGLDDSLFDLNSEGKYEIQEGKENLCIILGALLHYSILSSFMWMLITAILQFIRYVIVLGSCRPSRFMIKFTILGWGVPIIPVIFVLTLDSSNYIPDSSNSICYPNGIYFITSVLIPVFIIIVTNVTLFILVIISISRRSDKPMRAPDIDLVGAQLRLSIFLFFLLGLTWLFGIFSFSANLIWSYLFCLTSTLQGFIIFIYFIILDPSTRNLWVTLMKPQLSTSRDSITTTSISMG